MLRSRGVVCYTLRLHLPTKYRSQHATLSGFSTLLDVDDKARKGAKRIPHREASRPRQHAQQKLFDEIWNKNFAKVKAHVEQLKRDNPDATPTTPLSDPALRRWLVVQRHMCKLKYREGNTLTDERQAKLESLGMLTYGRDEVWKIRYQQVAEFVKKRGYFPYDLEPEGLSDYESQLYWWCRRQKQAYKLHRNQEEEDTTRRTGMKPERVALLNEIGFCWNVNEAGWLAHFEDLKAYHAEFGDCLVPKLYVANPVLGFWVSAQRAHYVRFKRNQKSNLNMRRIELLDSIGFERNVRQVRWLKRYHELEKHFALNGIGVLPNYKHNRSLRSWVDTQQGAYRLLRAGKKSRMTKERAKLWEKLGYHDNEKS